MSVRRSLPDEWIVFANSTCLPDRLPSLFWQSWSDRISRLFSGVRSSCDMFARNSDLYLDVRASCLALSSRAWRACSTSRFFDSTSWFCSTSSCAFSCSSLLVVCSSCWRLCNSLASDCDCSSRSSVRMLASIVLMTMPIDSVSWSRKAWWVGFSRSKRRELEHAVGGALEHDRQHEDVAGIRLAQIRRRCASRSSGSRPGTLCDYRARTGRSGPRRAPTVLPCESCPPEA